MLYVIVFEQQNGNTEMLFSKDTVTGISARDVLEVPGVLDNLLAQYKEISVKLKRLDGTIGNYRTAGYGLVIDGKAPAAADNNTLSQILSIPATAAQSMIRTLDETQRDYVEASLDAIKLFEGINASSRLCLPAECLSELDPELAKSLLTTKKSYTLKDTQNQYIFQAYATAEYGLQLPSLAAIQGGDEDIITALDILRTIAPYRKPGQAGSFSYNSIYHTPYFRVDARLRGMVPSHLDWINGYSSNDLLDIQSNEQHMANNLYTYICSDNARHVVSMVSGVFFGTLLGGLLNRLCSDKSAEIAYDLCDDIRNSSTTEASCEIPLSEIDALISSGWYTADVTEVVKKHLVIQDGYLRELLTNRAIDRRIIDCATVPFRLPLTDSQEREFTELLIDNGYMSHHMRAFLLGLCKKAYRVNWGHTGAVLAVPGFVNKLILGEVDKQMGEYLREVTNGRGVTQSKYPLLYLSGQPSDADEDSVIVDRDGGKSDDEVFSRFDYYVTGETIQKMIDDALPSDFFFTKASPAQSTEASIVEYWRIVNGEDQLDNFLLHAYLKTGDVQVFIESFIKLMRWGERKPKLLVLQKHPEIRYVLDLNTGALLDNTTIVDENDLVKVNGCDYSLVSFLTTSSNAGIPADQVIGFVLRKDYGKVQKDYLASWLDIGEMCASGAVNIGDLVMVKPLGSSMPRVNIEDYSKTEYQLYVSDSNIEEGLKLKVQARDLSAVALLVTPGITSSPGYLRSLKNQHVITVRDRQYDILRRYFSVFDAFSSKCASEGWSIENTVQLKEMSLYFLNLHHGTNGKMDSNQAAADKALKTLNFDSGTSAPVIQWDTSELEGSFYLIADKEMKSSLPPIEFSDPRTKAVALRQLNRIIMLLLQTDTKFILCRKDITASEVRRVQTKDAAGNPTTGVGIAKYSTYAGAVESLKAGGTAPTIKGLPLVLHKSLKGLL